MKYTLKKPIVLWCILLMAILGVTSGYGLGSSNDVLAVYQGVLSVITIRYAIIIIILIADYLVFSNLNNHVIISRYKSSNRFILKATVIETVVITLVALIYNIPIILFNMECFSILFVPVIYTTVNMIIISILITSIIRFINLWFNNRALVTATVFALYIGLDFLLENINFLYISNIIFDFQYIFTLPLELNSSEYIIVASIILIISFLLIFATMVLIGKRDYFLNEHETL